MELGSTEIIANEFDVASDAELIDGGFPREEQNTS